MKNGIGKGSLGFVPALAGKGVTTSGGAAPSRAPKAEIYVCSRHGKRWIPLGSHWGIHLPTLDPSEMPNFPRGCSAFLKSQPRPRWLLRSRPQRQVPPRASCLSPKAPDNWLGAKQHGLGLPFSWSS